MPTGFQSRYLFLNGSRGQAKKVSNLTCAHRVSLSQKRQELLRTLLRTSSEPLFRVGRGLLHGELGRTIGDGPELPRETPLDREGLLTLKL